MIFDIPELPGEQAALSQVREIADMWGYGRLIQYLHYKWAEKLVKEHGLDARTAAQGALMDEEDVKLFVRGRRM